MGKDIAFLITLLQGSDLLGMTTIRVCLRLDKTKEEGDWFEYPMEKDSRERLHAMLPLHCQSIGSIVDVQRIFDCHVAS